MLRHFWGETPQEVGRRIGHYGVGSIVLDKRSLEYTLVETQGRIKSSDKIVIKKPSGAAERTVVV